MMHVLNPIIDRLDLDNRQMSGGSYFYPLKCFVACSCGWHEWWGSKSEAEDRWIDHMENPDRWLGE